MVRKGYTRLDKFTLVYSSGSQPGVRVPLGVPEKLTGGTQNFKNHSKGERLGRIFDLGVCQGDTILIWGYAEGYIFDLGVRQYQKFEMPLVYSKHIIILLKIKVIFFLIMLG